MNNSSKSEPFRTSVLFNIRDAEIGKPGLNANELRFLLIVELRGILFTRPEQTYHDMRMGKTTYYKTLNRLIERGLVTVKAGRRYASGAQAPSQIRVDAGAIAKLPKRTYGTAATGTPAALTRKKIIRRRQEPEATEGRPRVIRRRATESSKDDLA